MTERYADAAENFWPDYWAAEAAIRSGLFDVAKGILHTLHVDDQDPLLNLLMVKMATPQNSSLSDLFHSFVIVARYRLFDRKPSFIMEDVVNMTLSLFVELCGQLALFAADEATLNDIDEELDSSYLPLRRNTERHDSFIYSVAEDMLLKDLNTGSPETASTNLARLEELIVLFNGQAKRVVFLMKGIVEAKVKSGEMSLGEGQSSKDIGDLKTTRETRHLLAESPSIANHLRNLDKLYQMVKNNVDLFTQDAFTLYGVEKFFSDSVDKKG